MEKLTFKTLDGQLLAWHKTAADLAPHFAQALEMERQQIQQLRSEREELMKALEMFTILNTAHYKDIAGLINNAVETLNRMKEAGR